MAIFCFGAYIVNKSMVMVTPIPQGQLQRDRGYNMRATLGMG